MSKKKEKKLEVDCCNPVRDSAGKVVLPYGTVLGSIAFVGVNRVVPYITRHGTFSAADLLKNTNRASASTA